MASGENAYILKVLSKRTEARFEKVFNRLDKKESNGYLTTKQLKDFWNKRDFDVMLYNSLKDSFDLENPDKRVNLDGKTFLELKFSILMILALYCCFKNSRR